MLMYVQPYSPEMHHIRSTIPILWETEKTNPSRKYWFDLLTSGPLVSAGQRGSAFLWWVCKYRFSPNIVGRRKQVPCAVFSDRHAMRASGSCCWIMRVARSQSHPAAANCLKWPTSENSYSGSSKQLASWQEQELGLKLRRSRNKWGRNIERQKAAALHSWHKSSFFCSKCCAHMLGWKHTSLLLDPIRHHISRTIIAKFNQLDDVRGRGCKRQGQAMERARKRTGGEGWQWHHAFRAGAGPEANAEYTPNSLVYFP